MPESLNSEELSCKDKLVFDSKELAEASLVTIEHQRNVKLKVYKCRECQLWHLASAV